MISHHLQDRLTWRNMAEEKTKIPGCKTILYVYMYILYVYIIDEPAPPAYTTVTTQPVVGYAPPVSCVQYISLYLVNYRGQ